jgi:hypothetical protein
MESAQIDLPRKLYGLRAGLNFASLTGDDVNEAMLDSRTGFVLGGFAVFRQTPTFALQVEAAYSMQGVEIDVGSESGTIILDYIQFPVLARLDFHTDGGSVQPHIFAGPQISVLVTSEVKANGMTQDIEPETSPLDVGIVLGGAIDIPMQEGGISIGMRYEHGFISVDDTGDAEDIRNSVVSVMSGYWF